MLIRCFTHYKLYGASVVPISEVRAVAMPLLLVIRNEKEFGVASKGTTIIQNLIRIGNLVQMLKWGNHSHESTQMMHQFHKPTLSPENKF
jgi:hypothetical protein